MKKSSPTVKEESTICPMMDENVKQTLLESLDREIARLQKAKDAILAGGGIVSTDSLTMSSTPSTTTLSMKGHVSQEAKQRLSQRMKLVWAVRKAQSQGHRAAIKEAKEALETWDRENPKK
jgi:hypothetical protein